MVLEASSRPLPHDGPQRRLRLAIVCYPTYGGSGVVATELGRCLAERGHQVHFVSYGLPFRLDQQAENVFFHKVTTLNYPLFPGQLYTLGLASKLADLADQHQLDLIHCHYAIPHAMSALLAKQMARHPIQVVTTLHGTDITLVGRDPSFYRVTRHAIEASDGTTAVSAYLAEETVRRFCCECEIRVIHNFADERVFFPPYSAPPGYSPEEERRQVQHLLGFPPGTPWMLHVSNFRPLKNSIHTVEILHRLVMRGVRAGLVLIGDGIEMPRVVERIHQLGLEEWVRCLGARDQPAAFYRHATLFLLPSQNESFGLAALEAMACGTPVVVSRAGGLPEVVVEGETGFMVEPGDLDDFAEACIRLIEDPELRRRLGERAFHHARQNFDREAIVSQYENYYLSLLGVLAESPPAGQTEVEAG